MTKFHQYPKCTTCKKAVKFLDEHDVNYEFTDIVQHTPTKKEFKNIVDKMGMSINKLLNTHGTKYRELNLKEKLKNMSDDEKLELLASDGMLVKHPLAISDNHLTLGFKENEYQHQWLQV